MAAMLFVWFAGVSASIKAFLVMVGFAIGMCIIFIPLFAGMAKDDETAHSLWAKLGKWFAPVIFVMFAVAACMPSEKTTYMMAGAYVGQKVLVESDASQKVYSIINKKLDAYLTEDTTEKAEKSVRNTAEKVEEMAVDAAKEKAKEVLSSNKKE